MDRIRIRGGRPLHGAIPIGGAKNAALPLMTAGMLTDDRLVLGNVPRLADIATMAALVSQHGPACEAALPEHGARTLSIGGPITNTEAPYDIVRKMRASILVLGPLLARVREARVSLPGGCAIGTRPVDLHLKGLEQMGAEIRTGGRLHPCRRARRPARRRHHPAVRQRRRHREPADGRLPRRRPDRDRQRRPRAGDHRPGGLPDRNGRPDHRRRLGQIGDRGRAPAARRPPSHRRRTGSRPAPTPAPPPSPAARSGYWARA